MIKLANNIKKVTALAALYVRQQGFGQCVGRIGIASEGSEAVNTDMRASNVEIESLVQAPVGAGQAIVGATYRLVCSDQQCHQHGHVSKEKMSDWLSLSATDVNGVLEPYASMLQGFSGRSTGTRRTAIQGNPEFSDSFIMDRHTEWARLTPRSVRSADGPLKRYACMFTDRVCEYVAPLRMLYWLFRRMLPMGTQSA